jgi:hypothetical protein
VKKLARINAVVRSASVFLALIALPFALADNGVNNDTQNTQAFAKYGLTGKGVIVAVLDRGLDYTHPDFRNSDGTTRIKKMWDMSNVNPDLAICDPTWCRCPEQDNNNLVINLFALGPFTRIFCLVIAKNLISVALS